MKITLLFYEVSFFLHYGWFVQNVGKDFVRTNMHTTVMTQICRPRGCRTQINRKLEENTEKHNKKCQKMIKGLVLN